MARKGNNLDVSTVAYKAEVLYKGEKYDEPLFKIVDQALFEATFEKRFGKPVHQRSNRSSTYCSELIRLNRYFRERYSEFEDLKADIMSPLRYETELDRALCFKDEINAMRDLYYACLDCETSDRTDTEQIFQLLFLSAHYYSKCKVNVESAWSFFSANVLDHPLVAKQKKRAISKYLSGISGIYSLGTIYNDFSQRNEGILHQYEYRFNGKFNANTNIEAPLKENPPKRSARMNCYLYYWQNQKFSSDLRGLFWNYCRTLPPSEIQEILFNRKTKELSELILDVLDRRLESALEDTRPQLCTKDATVRWEAGSLEAAEYISLYCELVQRKKYRICPICGSLFELSGRYKTKVYCDLHNANQIQYFNRIRNNE